MSSAFSVHGVRYQVRNVERSIALYTQHLGFKVQRCFQHGEAASYEQGSNGWSREAARLTESNCDC
jgi:catechol 2,3-dioxygenase-like lactoylglutathione lyase family enzyme